MFLWAVQLTFPLSEFKKNNIQSNEAYAIIMAVLNFLLFPINRANEKPGMANGTIYGTGMVIQIVYRLIILSSPRRQVI